MRLCNWIEGSGRPFRWLHYPPQIGNSSQSQRPRRQSRCRQGVSSRNETILRNGSQAVEQRCDQGQWRRRPVGRSPHTGAPLPELRTLALGPRTSQGSGRQAARPAGSAGSATLGTTPTRDRRSWDLPRWKTGQRRSAAPTEGCAIPARKDEGQVRRAFCRGRFGTGSVGPRASGVRACASSRVAFAQSKIISRRNYRSPRALSDNDIKTSDIIPLDLNLQLLILVIIT